MTAHTAEEILIERKLTFRNSTFGGLKSYIREHQRKTGQRLTNAAAVDRLLRAQLVYDLERNAASRMVALAQPEGAEALQGVADTPECRSRLLPVDAAEHLRAYQQACNSETQLHALIDIIRSSALFGDILRRNGRPLSEMLPLARATHALQFQGAVNV